MKVISSIFFIVLFTNIYSQNTILWEVSLPDKDTKSYLLGTYHQLGNSFVDSIPIIKKKLLESQVAIFESIDKEQLVERMNKRECTNEITNVLKKNELLILDKVSENWKVNTCKLTPQEIFVKLYQELPKTTCNTVKPTDTWGHFDNYLLSIAKANDKEVIGLETTSFQSEVINKGNVSVSQKDAGKRIKKLLKRISDNKPDPDVCNQVNNYRNFRIDYAFDKKCPESITLKGRNQSWMQKLPNLLKENSCFVVVGLAHLMMECGLIEKLKNDGFIIKPVDIKKL